jgi:hypothetical protein
MWKDVRAVGGIPEDDLEEDEVKQPETVLDPEDRKAMLFSAMEQVVTAGERESFTGNGSPHAKVISEIVGFTIDAKERDAVWTEFRQANQAD